MSLPQWVAWALLALVVLGVVATLVEAVLHAQLRGGYVRFLSRLRVVVEIPIPDLEPGQLRGFDGEGQRALWKVDDGEVLWRRKSGTMGPRAIGRIVFDSEGRATATWGPCPVFGVPFLLAFVLGSICACSWSFGSALWPMLLVIGFLMALASAISAQRARRAVHEELYADVELHLVQHMRLIDEGWRPEIR